MNATTKRAAKGGEIGANGEWYEGGKFINTIPENSKREGIRPSKPRKVEIEPYKWVLSSEAPEGKPRSIYGMFSGCFGKVVNGKMQVLCSDVTLQYCRRTREEAQAIADAYNAGERWMPYDC